MKMGVREFRDRISEVVNGSEPVLVTKNGEVVGRYLPLVPRKQAEPVDWPRLLADVERANMEWKASTPDWRERLRSIGIDDDGELLEG